MDNRSILAIAFCVLFYLGYSHYLSTKYPNQGKEQQQAGETGQTAAPQPTQPAAGTPSTAAPGTATPQAQQPATPTVLRLAPEDLRLESDVATYQFNQEIGGFQSVTLKSYKSSNDADSRPMDLLDSPMALQGTTDPRQEAPFQGLFNAERKGRTMRFWRDAGDFRITQEFTVPETGYGADMKVGFTNISGKPVDLTGGLLMTESILPKKNPSLLGIIPGTVRQRDQIVYNADNSTEWIDIEKFCKDDKDPPKLNEVPVKYLGIDRHYFLSVVEPKAKTGSVHMGHGKMGEAGCPLALVNFDRQGTIQPGDTATVEYTTFFGPKDMPVLKAHSPDLESAMHLGTFGFIGRPLLMVIQGFFKITKNYGIAIILVTIGLKILFFPLVRSSSTSMHRMKKLNPQMNAIREKYKDDKQKQQQELMKFMMSNKMNPMKGCLPILPQIPVFFAFYQVLQTSIALRHAPFFGWIHDLSAMDPYFITPVLMGVAMFAQQKLTPTTGMDKTQEKILMFMPIMFTAMMLTLPAGLTLYMLTNTVFGITQQKWLYRRLDKLEA